MQLPNVVVRRLIEVPEVLERGLEALHNTDRLNMSPESQKGDNWCWAALSVAFQDLLHTGNETQCSLVQTVLRHDEECCVDGRAREGCDVQMTLDDGFAAANVDATRQLGSLLFNEVIAEITGRRKPVACLIEFTGADNHVAEIDGYIDDGSRRTYIVNDPAIGEHTISHEDMVSNYNNRGGRWVETYTVV